ncbi:hypothetical protein [Mycobacterium uberis]|nr:hypothetical protein [Mycobacterium uberis]
MTTGVAGQARVVAKIYLRRHIFEAAQALTALPVAIAGNRNAFV